MSIVGVSTRLRERLGRVLYLFRQNAQIVVPDEMKEYIRSHPTPIKPVRRWKTNNISDSRADFRVLPYTILDKPDGLAQEFRQFSEDVIALFECFDQYPEFLEELPDRSFAEDLQVCM